MLSPLLEIERQVINAQLDQNGELNRYVRERQQKGERIDDEILEKLRVLRERHVALTEPLKSLNRFEPARVRLNRHEYRFG